MSEFDEKQQQSAQYKCNCCGANMVYDASTQKLYCPHCENVQEIERNCNVVERDFAELEKAEKWDEETVSCYQCSNCGARTTLSKTTKATNCPYCGSAVVMTDEANSPVKPNTVIPFEVDLKTASAQLAHWRKGKLFAPKSFRKDNVEASIKGVYSPVWTFDSETTTKYAGRLGQHRTRTVTRNGKTETETYTEYFNVSGTIDYDFDDILIRGNDNLPEKDFTRLQPFPQSKYVVYDDKYLAGYIADNYSVEPMDAYAIAKQRMENTIRNAILNKYDADVEQYLNMDVHTKSRSFKYLMLPFYVAVSHFGEKRYNQYISGLFADNSNKKVRISGRAPVSGLKAGIFGFVCVAIVAVIAYFLSR